MTFDQATAIISRPGNHSVANVRAAVRAIVQMNKPDYADGWPLGWGLVQQKLDAALLTAGKFADAYPLGEKWDAALADAEHDLNVEQTLDEQEDREGDYR